jgi:hypothetical protein
MDIQQFIKDDSNHRVSSLRDAMCRLSALNEDAGMGYLAVSEGNGRRLTPAETQEVYRAYKIAKDELRSFLRSEGLARL